MYGLNKLYLLMEKQHNRGQDGAGVAAIKLNTEPGYPFLHRIRSNASQPIADIFFKIGQEVAELEKYQPEELSAGQQDSPRLQQSLQKLDASINQLPDQCRKVFLLHRERGMSYYEIADQLAISTHTVKNHMSSILRKLSVNDRTQAVVYAMKQGWIRIPED